MPVDGLESLSGYLLRLAEANGYQDSRWIPQRASLPKDFVYRAFDCGSLAELTGLTFGDVGKLAYWTTGGKAGFTDGVDVVPGVLEFHRPKVCALCLSEQAWARRLWDLRALLACPVHCCLLLDTCPACGIRISWSRPSLRRCRCGADLTDGPVTAAPHELVAVAKLLVTLSAGVASPSSETPVNSLDAAARLLSFFAADPASEGGTWRRRHMSKHSVSAAAHSYSMAAPILLDFPAGLHGWLDAQSRRSSGAGMRQAFGSALNRMLATLRGPGFDVLHSALRTWLAEEWGGGFVKPWSPLFTSASAPPVVSAKHAARRLGVSSATVVRMLDSGQLRGETRHAGSRRVNLISSGSLDRGIRELAGALTVREAGAHLGVSAAQVRALTRTGLLVAGYRMERRIRVRCYTRAALSDFVRLIDEQTAPPVQQGGLVTLEAVAADRIVSFVSVIRAIVAGRVAVSRGPAPAGGPELSRYSVNVRNAVDDRTAASLGLDPERCLSVRQGAEALSVSVRMIPVLVAAGCLAAAGGTDGGKVRKRTLTDASVSVFRANYVMARELAAHLATSTRSVVRLLEAAGIRPVVAGSSAAGISSVWLRSAVAAVPRMAAAETVSSAGINRGSPDTGCG